VTAGLFALTFALGAPPPPAGLQKGDEFTFAGTIAEAVDRPSDRFRRNHALELRVFVLDRQEKWADAAVLTRLTRIDDAVTGAVSGVTGAGSDKNAPPSVRLEIVRVYTDGSVHLLAPVGPPPLKFTADTPARALPLLPLDGFATAEFGIFPPHPPRNNTGDPWAVAAAGDRPPETWQAKEFKFVTAERCQLLIMNQESTDWAKPVGGQTSWHRADAILVSTQDGMARRVHRVIRQRDGRTEAPTAWVEVKYELKEQTQLSGRAFDRGLRDVEIAYTSLADAAALQPDAIKLGPKTFEMRLSRLDAHLADMEQTSPYREAMLTARRALDAARRGEAVPIAPISTSIPSAAPARSSWPEVGQLAPDFRAGAFRLADHKSKPVVLVFFRPAGETTDLSLAIANAVEKRYAGKVLVVPLAVFGDVSTGVKDCDRLKFTLPVFDGSGTANGYGVETVPRFAIIDTAGKVRWTFTGVGAETGFLLKEEMDRLIVPASPNAAGGTNPSPGPGLPPIVPRP
jgi:hypothetical protein